MKEESYGDITVLIMNQFSLRPILLASSLNFTMGKYKLKCNEREKDDVAFFRVEMENRSIILPKSIPARSFHRILLFFSHNRESQNVLRATMSVREEFHDGFRRKLFAFMRLLEKKSCDEIKKVLKVRFGRAKQFKLKSSLDCPSKA